MNDTVVAVLLTAALIVGAPGESSAQVVPASEAAAAEGPGGGGIFDWIHKLSGPAFIGAGISIFYETGSRERGVRGIRPRADLVFRTSVSEKDAVRPATANITMISLQPSVEVPIRILPLSIAPGIGIHTFGGDVDRFTHFSIPVIARIQPPQLAARIGTTWFFPTLLVGIHYFPKFDADDFAPLSVDVSRDNGEFVLTLGLALDLRW